MYRLPSPRCIENRGWGALFLLSLAILIILYTFSPRNLRQIEECSIKDPNPELHFATKTPYEAVRGETRYPNGDCTPVFIWMLARHGSRFATRGKMRIMKQVIQLKKEIMESYETAPVKNGLCKDDFAALKNWNWDYVAERETGRLNEQGWQDLYVVGRRYGEAYPELFGNYSEKRHVFGHTHSTRNKESLQAFADGVFGDGTHARLKTMDPSVVDAVAKSYDDCPEWMDLVWYHDDSKIEINNFRRSVPFTRLRHDMSRRLGFSRTLEASDLEAMYDNCRMDATRFDSSASAWCGTFARGELDLLEYEADLTRFYLGGTSHRFHAMLGCTTLKHLREALAEKTQGGGEVSALAMFTHDTMLDMVYAALGYGDPGYNLSGAVYEDVYLERKYRTTYLMPFAANMAVVLYRCPFGPDPYVVQLLNNEFPMEIKGCPAGRCSLEYFLNFTSFATECNLDFCKKTNIPYVPPHKRNVTRTKHKKRRL